MLNISVETSRDSMGGPITNELNPVQKERSKYACIILEASTTQFETMYTFLARGGQVFIDSTFGFDVSLEKLCWRRVTDERLVG